MALRVRNWKTFQHFKDRKPPWIKLYRDILDDPDWHNLDNESTKVLVMIWLVASEDEYNEGTLPSISKLAFRLRLTESKLSACISKLSHWLIQDDINMISSCHQHDAPETETETYSKETEKEVVAVAPRSPKGSRLPNDWVLPDEWGHWAESQGMQRHDILQEEEKFRDYWIARTGKEAIKADWQATWRNWIRRRLENGLQRIG